MQNKQPVVFLSKMRKYETDQFKTKPTASYVREPTPILRGLSKLNTPSI